MAGSERETEQNTRRNYQAAIRAVAGVLATQFVAILGRCTCELWEEFTTGMRDWQSALRAGGLSESTVNHQLSCEQFRLL